jgi:alkylhydroperoxidase/carboxymuconolactone decarboxylase family protein YurZ
MPNVKQLTKLIEGPLRGGKYGRIRLLAILSAAITYSKPEITSFILNYLKKKKILPKAILETILQSHLLIGFPRMIEAAIVYNEIFGNTMRRRNQLDSSIENCAAYFEKGEKLCRKIYGKNFDRLKNRINAIAPEIFEWIIIEAYGKVLSRPGLRTIERELSMMAILIVENQKRQLVSHVMGSLNAGSDFNLIRKINKDILPFAGPINHRLAERIISGIENKYETAK